MTTSQTQDSAAATGTPSIPPPPSPPPSPAAAAAPLTPPTAPQAGDPVHDGTVLALDLYHLVLVVVLAALLFQLWPERLGSDGGWRDVYLPFTNDQRRIGDDARLILIVLFAGALGSCEPLLGWLTDAELRRAGRS